MSKRIYAQASLFRRNKLEEQNISYTPGPNPDLNYFIQHQSSPYDPTADTYNTTPFSKPITSTKATAIYGMHSYHQGKKPHDAIREYIRHYTKPGDLVLDSFCGSGGTALAALIEGRKAVAIDLSPAATFITKNYCTPLDSTPLQLAFQKLKAKLKSEMDWLYGTRCDRCDGQANILYTVYSFVFQCPRCLEKVPIFDCVEDFGQTSAGKPKKISACPYCHQNGQIEEISTRSERFEPVPVMVSYECLDGCSPKRAERSHRDPNEKKRDYFKKYDLGKIQEIDRGIIPYWYPHHRMMNVESDTEPWGDEWRPSRNFRTVSELFTKRNLRALAAFLAEAEKQDDYKDIFRFTLTGSCLHASKMSHHKEGGGGITVGTYYIPPMFKERNVRDLISRKFKDVIKAEIELETHIKSSDLLISTQSATDLSEIPDNSIDYIFTDPPYSNRVQYGELNFIWEAWLNLDPNWHDKEIIVNNIRQKSETDWANLMIKAFRECYRVLKPGRWLSLCYHDSSEGTWELVQDIMAETGFISERTEAALYIDTAQKSYNQYVAANVTKRDLVINFRKPHLGELPQQLVLLGDEDVATFAEKSRAILQEALEAHPGSPSDRLYDELVSRMVRQRSFERHNFNELLRSVAEEVDGRWYLLATAGQVDAAESAKEEAAAVRLETFMQTYLAENPGETGIHFSDLFEQNLYVQDKPRRDLKDWLPEYFFRTESGTWRPPANDEERAQKAALRSSGALRRIKRFGNALLEGVPPAQRDQPENLATAAEWLRQCRRAGLYELGRALFEKGGFNFSELDDEAYLEVEEDYQICVRRS